MSTLPAAVTKHQPIATAASRPEKPEPSRTISQVEADGKKQLADKRKALLSNPSMDVQDPDTRKYLSGESVSVRWRKSSAEAGPVAQWCIEHGEPRLLEQLCHDVKPGALRIPAGARMVVGGRKVNVAGHLRSVLAPHGLVIDDGADAAALKETADSFRHAVAENAEAAGHERHVFSCVASVEIGPGAGPLEALCDALSIFPALESVTVDAGKLDREASTRLVNALATSGSFKALTLKGLTQGCDPEPLAGLLGKEGLARINLLDEEQNCAADFAAALMLARPFASPRHIVAPPLPGATAARLLEQVNQPDASIHFTVDRSVSYFKKIDLTDAPRRLKHATLDSAPGRHMADLVSPTASALEKAYAEEARQGLMFGTQATAAIMNGFSAAWKPAPGKDAGLASHAFLHVEAGLPQYLGPKDLASLSSVNRATAGNTDAARNAVLRKEFDTYVGAGGAPHAVTEPVEHLHHRWMPHGTGPSWISQPLLGNWDDVTPDNFNDLFAAVKSNTTGRLALRFTPEVDAESVVKLVNMLSEGPPRNVSLTLPAPVEGAVLDALTKFGRVLVDVTIGSFTFRPGKTVPFKDIPADEILGGDASPDQLVELLYQMKMRTQEIVQLRADALLRAGSGAEFGKQVIEERTWRIKVPAKTLAGNRALREKLAVNGVLDRIIATASAELVNAGNIEATLKTLAKLRPLGEVSLQVAKLTASQLAQLLQGLQADHPEVRLRLQLNQRVDAAMFAVLSGCKALDHVSIDGRHFHRGANVEEPGAIALGKTLFDYGLGGPLLDFLESMDSSPGLAAGQAWTGACVDRGMSEPLNRLLKRLTGPVRVPAGAMTDDFSAPLIRVLDDPQGWIILDFQEAVTPRTLAETLQLLKENAGVQRLALRAGELRPGDLLALLQAVRNMPALKSAGLVLQQRVDGRILAELAGMAFLQKLELPGGHVMERGKPMEEGASAFVKAMFLSGWGDTFRRLQGAMGIPQAAWETQLQAEALIEMSDIAGLASFLKTAPHAVRIPATAAIFEMKGEAFVEVPIVRKLLDEGVPADRFIEPGPQADPAAAQPQPGESPAADSPEPINGTHFEQRLRAVGDAPEIEVHSLTMSDAQWLMLADFLGKTASVTSVRINDEFTLVRGKPPMPRTKLLLDSLLGTRPALKDAIVKALNIEGERLAVRRTSKKKSARVSRNLGGTRDRAASGTFAGGGSVKKPPEAKKS